MSKLMVDSSRRGWAETCIFVRAEFDKRSGTHDIAHLDLPSLLAWLRSRGGKNEWAETCVALILGHAPEKVREELTRL